MVFKTLIIWELDNTGGKEVLYRSWKGRIYPRLKCTYSLSSCIGNYIQTFNSNIYGHAKSSGVIIVFTFQLNFDVYRPQRSCWKVFFLQACVKNSVHTGVCILAYTGADTPIGGHPPGSHSPGQTPARQIRPNRHTPGRNPPPQAHIPSLGRHPSSQADIPLPGQTPSLPGQTSHSPPHSAGIHSCF